MPITRTEVLAVVCLLTTFILVMVTFIVKVLFFLQKKQRVHTTNLVEVKANYERELYKAQLEIQEQTFQEIARELHDNVGQILSLAKMGLGTLDLEKKNDAKQTILETSDILEKALEDIRYMSRSMNADVIKKGGLKKSIEMQVGFIQRGGKYDTHFNVIGDHVSLEDNKEMLLFRIAQEALNNIIRHSKASDICITLSYSKLMLVLEIKDNGMGFNINDKISANGIYNMQYRAKLIGAEFQIESIIGKGTSITVITPI